MVNGPPVRKAPKAKEDRYERLEKSSTCKVGMQVSCCNFAEVPEKGHIWSTPPKDRSNTSGIMSSQGSGIGRRQCVVGPYPHAVECSTEV